MDTIELWEQEIANQPGFFETMNEQIDFLCESIELDYKLLEMGILTEADEENTESGDNADNNNDGNTDSSDNTNNENNDNTDSSKGSGANDKIILTFKKKLIIVLQKIAASLLNLALRIKKFVSEKINDFKQNNIIKKFASAKIDPEKMAEKLNKTTLFDPQEFFKVCIWYGVFGEYLGQILGKPTTAVTYTKNKDIDTLTAKINTLQSLITPKDANNSLINTETKEGNQVTIKIDPKNAQKEITDLYEKTSSVLEQINKKVEHLSKDVKNEEENVKKITDKEQLKSAKGVLTLFKSTYKASMRIASLYIKQCNVLQALMVAFAVHKGEENKEETNNNNNEEEK